MHYLLILGVLFALTTQLKKSYPAAISPFKTIADTVYTNIFSIVVIYSTLFLGQDGFISIT